MAEELDNKKESRTFKKHTYRGISIDKLKEMPLSEFMLLLPSRKRRRFRRGITQREVNLLRKCAKAKEKVESSYDQPKVVNTHSNTMIIVPQMVGNIIGVYRGNGYVQLEIKPEMIGYCLNEFILLKAMLNTERLVLVQLLVLNSCLLNK